MNSEVKKNPIGIFDSGVGGLTVAKAIADLMPLERIIYYGDTLHLPYGDKSPQALKYYAEEITRFLIKSGAKAIVVACNTASAVAFPTVLKQVNKKAICLNVIDPSVAYVANNNPNGVAIIGTKTTIYSGVYEKRLQKAGFDKGIFTMATPLLAPMIEEGIVDNEITKNILQFYLNNKGFENIEQLVLGCTHYPLVEKQIKEILPKVKIVNAAKLVALKLKEAFENADILADKPNGMKSKFMVSDYTSFFEKQAQLFFGDSIPLKKENIWK